MNLCSYVAVHLSDYLFGNFGNLLLPHAVLKTSKWVFLADWCAANSFCSVWLACIAVTVIKFKVKGVFVWHLFIFYLICICMDLFLQNKVCIHFSTANKTAQSHGPWCYQMTSFSSAGLCYSCSYLCIYASVDITNELLLNIDRVFCCYYYTVSSLFPFLLLKPGFLFSDVHLDILQEHIWQSCPAIFILLMSVIMCCLIPHEMTERSDYAHSSKWSPFCGDSGGFPLFRTADLY